MEGGCFFRIARIALVGFLGCAMASFAIEGDPIEKGREAWESLFNGKDLKGWIQVEKADWSVKDGLLIGRQGPNGAPGELLTDKEFDNFELSVTWKCTWPCNSGVWFRYQNPKLAYQADILEYKEPEAYTGTVYCPGIKELFLSRNLDKKIEKRDDWNHFLIRADGKKVTVYLNKKKVGDFESDRSMRGRIGFQVHQGDEFKNMQIQVKEIQIRQLRKD